ncbi:SGNH/GDSL hydrolase family protein [Oculatella sp. LEGE 06141]|uniref:SGNH/GDSL hydrolase family protein n=1 Tax=Oculatella sp. LEGE 06141 TaxID=1828648 RepID=UPI00187F1CBE|nr:SGNH/GDSL hydrolase family protein [Oculatella sp. LEGE 06141]MBE9182823.1 SGNH/GDSL hydrolase family protein [Oculatella sp. LEGE 06141]
MFTRHRRYQRKTQHSFRWLGLLLLLIAVPVGLELLTRVIADATGLSQPFAADQSSDMKRAYGLKFVSQAGQPYEGLADNGELLATRNVLLGYRLFPEQTNEFLTINEQGFRDDDDVPLQKPAGEVRIFVLGGSVAFGELSSSNQTTFANTLEARLNDQVAQQRANPERFQPATLPYRADQVDQALALPARIQDGQYRVINAAVPGYASGNELAMLVQQVAAYNPDMVVVLGGYADLLLSSSQMGSDVPGLETVLEGQSTDWRDELSEQFGEWVNQLYLVRGFRYYGLSMRQSEERLTQPINLPIANTGAPLSNSLTDDEAELDRRLFRYRYHLLQMVHWASATRKRLLIGIQPEITGRTADNLTPDEAAIVNSLGDTYTQRVQAGYEKLEAQANQVAQSSSNASVLNLYRLYDSFEGRAFLSPINLTDEANAALANRFYQAIAADLSITPQPFGSP